MIDNLLPMAVEFAEKNAWMVVLTLSQAILILIRAKDRKTLHHHHKDIEKRLDKLEGK